MPFKSKKQEGWMFAHKPQMAEQWAREKKPKFDKLDAYFEGGTVGHTPSNEAESTILVDDAKEKHHVVHRSPGTIETTDDQGRLHNHDPKLVDPDVLRDIKETQGPDPEHYSKGGVIGDTKGKAERDLEEVHQLNERLKKLTDGEKVDDELSLRPRDDFKHEPPKNYNDGGKVPGRPEVKGDSPKNDHILIMASPGEVVLPRSVTTAPDAPEKAKKFVRLHEYLDE